MEKIINYENLRNFTYVNDNVCNKPIKGIILSFFGLGCMDMYFEDTELGKFFGEKGILYVVPYNNPWAWMNRQSVDYTDEILDVLFDKYSLPENTPIVSTGESMGGLAALIYMVYAKRTPCACVANCPVCDAVFHYTERADLPRTLYSALYGIEGDLNSALATLSPLHLIEKMPKDAKYRIIHCNDDGAVNIHSHSENFVAAMKANGFDISLDYVYGRNHCDLTPEARELFHTYMTDAIKGA